MSRPNRWSRQFTRKVRRGLRSMASLAGVELDSGWLTDAGYSPEDRKRRADVEAAIEWIASLDEARQALEVAGFEVLTAKEAGIGGNALVVKMDGAVLQVTGRDLW